MVSPPQTSTPQSHPILTGILPAILVAVIGLGVSFLVYRFAKDWEASQLRGRLSVESDNRIEAVGEALAKMSSILASVHTLYRGSERVDREEFQAVTIGFISQNPGVLGLSWVPKVPGVRLRQFVSFAREQGLANYAVKQLSPQGKIVPAGPDIFYFPVLFVEPLAPNLGQLGLDLASDDILRERLLQSCEENRLVTTAHRLFSKGPPDRDTITMYQPHFVPWRGDGAYLLPPCPGLNGFIRGRFSFGAFYEKILSRHRPVGIDVLVLDLQARPEDRVLYFHGSRTRDNRVSPEQSTKETSRPDLVFSRDIRLGGGTWRVVCTPTAARLAEGFSYQPLGMAGLTLLPASAASAPCSKATATPWWWWTRTPAASYGATRRR